MQTRFILVHFWNIFTSWVSGSVALLWLKFVFLWSSGLEVSNPCLIFTYDSPTISFWLSRLFVIHLWSSFHCLGTRMIGWFLNDELEMTWNVLHWSGICLQELRKTLWSSCNYCRSASADSNVALGLVERNLLRHCYAILIRFSSVVQEVWREWCCMGFIRRDSKIEKKLLLDSSWLSVCPSSLPHGTTGLSLEGISWHLILKCFFFSKIWRENVRFITISQE